VFALYGSYRYGWGERSIGLTLAAVGICSAVVQGGLVRFASRFGDRRVLIGGLLFGVLGFAIYGFAETGLVFAIGIPIMGLWGLAGPAVQSLMTRGMPPSEQGQLQGANASLLGIAGLTGPMAFALVFAYFISKDAIFPLPGAPFLLASLILVASMTLAVVVTRTSSATST
jgi:DHA1 family tetracycline resistance protein-like MFS transporter